MADQRIQYTEEFIGSGHPTKSDTLNRIVVVDHNIDGTHKKPAFSAHKNGTNQSGLGAAVSTKITWSTELFDTDSCFAGSSFTPNVAGKYLLTSTLLIGAAVAGKLYYAIVFKNDVFFLAGPPIYAATGGSWGVGVCAIVDANGTTDKFDIYLFNGDTSDLEISGAGGNTWFSGCRIN